MHPALSNKIREASVIQNPVNPTTRVSYTERGKQAVLAVPGAATERTCTPLRLWALLCTIAYRAISIAKAMRWRRAARKATNVASMASVTCEESENRRAIKAIPVAASE